MNILVAGGAGFLGSHLVMALVRQGHRVLVVDNEVTGRNGACLPGAVPVLRTSVERIDEVDFARFRLDRVYHLASPTAPAAIQAHGSMTRAANGLGTCRLLQLAEAHGAPLLFTSSVKVHGECARVSDYIVGKRVGEELVCSAGQKVARLANVYGPGMALDDSRVVPQFIQRALRHEPLSLWNGGHQTDSFCYVTDVVRGLIDFMESAAAGVIEFGARETVSIRALADSILHFCRSCSELYELEAVAVSAKCHQVADLTRAGEALGWVPEIPLGPGLLATIADFKERMNASDQKVCVHAGHAQLGARAAGAHAATVEALCQEDRCGLPSHCDAPLPRMASAVREAADPPAGQRDGVGLGDLH